MSLHFMRFFATFMDLWLQWPVSRAKHGRVRPPFFFSGSEDNSETATKTNDRESHAADELFRAVGLREFRAVIHQQCAEVTGTAEDWAVRGGNSTQNLCVFNKKQVELTRFLAIWMRNEGNDRGNTGNSVAFWCLYRGKCHSMHREQTNHVPCCTFVSER